MGFSLELENSALHSYLCLVIVTVVIVSIVIVTIVIVIIVIVTIVKYSYSNKLLQFYCWRVRRACNMSNVIPISNAYVDPQDFCFYVYAQK